MAEEFHTSYADFVDPKVITIKISDDIITAIMPHFPKSTKVISAYLSAEQLYWKINYHWELALWAIDKLIGTAPDASTLTALKALKAELEGDKPSPASGYRTSKTVGLPKDSSTDEQILVRHAMLTVVKKKLQVLVDSKNLMKTWKSGEDALNLSFAPVASPLTGKHRTGYALDIKGPDKKRIEKIADSLGATVSFNERSHVHCEWKKGVDGTGAAAANSIDRESRAAKMKIEGGITNARHCMLRTA